MTANYVRVVSQLLQPDNNNNNDNLFPTTLNYTTMSVLPRRHLAKAITWRIVASLTTFIIGWIVTGDLDFGMAIGAADVFIKLVLYYLHERAWYHSNYGVIKDGKHIYKPIFQFWKKKKEKEMQKATVPLENTDKLK